MKQETIVRAAKSINRSIKFYQRKLTYQLEIRAEHLFNNGNIKVEKLDDYDARIAQYETIIADLATIERAIKVNKTSLKIYGNLRIRGSIYNETVKALKKAGFEVKGYAFGTIELIPIEE